MARTAVNNRRGLKKAIAGTVFGPLQLVFASTPAGKVLLLSCIIGVVIAVKSGSNHAVLTAALILGLLVADSLANYISMRGLEFSFDELPAEVWAGEKTGFRLIVKNRKPLIPAGNLAIDAVLMTNQR
ncbi:MAG TPA: hypothetical protein ENN09_02075, partial [Planctomycetes bacterium]|nr:hypothetical protein [Planctomycetota bacterium]